MRSLLLKAPSGAECTVSQAADSAGFLESIAQRGAWTAVDAMEQEQDDRGRALTPAERSAAAVMASEDEEIP